MKDGIEAINKMPLADYFIAQKEQRLSRCPHIIRKFEAFDMCNLNQKPCVIENCKIYKEEFNGD